MTSVRPLEIYRCDALEETRTEDKYKRLPKAITVLMHKVSSSCCGRLWPEREGVSDSMSTWQVTTTQLGPLQSSPRNSKRESDSSSSEYVVLLSRSCNGFAEWAQAK